MKRSLENDEPTWSWMIKQLVKDSSYRYLNLSQPHPLCMHLGNNKKVTPPLRGCRRRLRPPLPWRLRHARTTWPPPSASRTTHTADEDACRSRRLQIANSRGRYRTRRTAPRTQRHTQGTGHETPPPAGDAAEGRRVVRVVSECRGPPGGRRLTHDVAAQCHRLVLQVAALSFFCWRTRPVRAKADF